MTKPLVSIVMPIYRVEEYIEKSVKSVIAQTYKNIELILVDDGSPDKSVEIAERVLKEHSFPYKLIRQENGGIGEARNTGIRNSNGEWVLFLDSDDIILNNAIEKLLGATRDVTDLAFCGFKVIKSQNEVRSTQYSGKQIRFTPEQIQKEFLLRNHIVLAAGTLFRRALITNKNTLFGSMPWSEDQHFIWRILSVISEAVYVDEPLYRYLTRPGSIMTSSLIENILSGYPAICNLPSFYDDYPLIKKFLVPRWVLGTISSSAKITDYNSWLTLYDNLSGKEHMKTLLHFPSLKTRLRAVTCIVSKRTYYNFFSKRA